MKGIFFALMTLIVALFFVACGDQAAGNGTNKPANVANVANTTAPVSPAASEAEIRKLMETAEVALGKNDADAMDKIYADNYSIVNVDGSVQNKAERLAALRSGDTKYTEFKYSEPSIRINPAGDGATVVAKLAMKGTMKGKSIDGDYRVTQVYAKTKDGWKQVSAQATKIDAKAEKEQADEKLKIQQKAKNDAAADDMAVPPPPAKKK